MREQKIEKNLIGLCKIMIEIFFKAVESGLITSEQYQEYTKFQFEFLENYDK